MGQRTVQFPTGSCADQPTQEWNVEARGDVASFDVIMERVVTASVADIHVELPAAAVRRRCRCEAALPL